MASPSRTPVHIHLRCRAYTSSADLRDGEEQLRGLELETALDDLARPDLSPDCCRSRVHGIRTPKRDASVLPSLPAATVDTARPLTLEDLARNTTSLSCLGVISSQVPALQATPLVLEAATVRTEVRLGELALLDDLPRRPSAANRSGRPSDFDGSCRDRSLS